MAQSAVGKKFLDARREIVRRFGITVDDRKDLEAQLAKYDDLVMDACRPHLIGEVLGVLRSLAAARAANEEPPSFEGCLSAIGDMLLAPNPLTTKPGPVQ